MPWDDSLRAFELSLWSVELVSGGVFALLNCSEAVELDEEVTSADVDVPVEFLWLLEAEDEGRVGEVLASPSPSLEDDADEEVGKSVVVVLGTVRVKEKCRVVVVRVKAVGK